MTQPLPQGPSALTRRQQRVVLLALVDEGPWYERLWLPLLRFVHRHSEASDRKDQLKSLNTQHQPVAS